MMQLNLLLRQKKVGICLGKIDPQFFLKAAELIAGPYRSKINAATMIGQSKTVHQAEIDSACELIDFLRFNVEYVTQIYSNQPVSDNDSQTELNTDL